MVEEQVELTPEEEARIKWEQLLRGKPTVVVDTVPEEEAVEEALEEPTEPEVIVVDNSQEAVLAKLYKSMIKD
jgi:hypothetical protein